MIENPRVTSLLMKPHTITQLSDLSDDALIARITELARARRRTTACLIAHLVEMEKRELHLARGYSSLFTYCAKELHLSEHAAYGRIEAARAARRFPIILEELASGALHLTAVGLLAKHLTPENYPSVLRAAEYKSKREIEEIVAALRPLPDVPTTVRRLPSPSRPPTVPNTSKGSTAETAGRSTACETQSTLIPTPEPPTPLAPLPRPAVIAPLAPERYKVQLTTSKVAQEKLRRLQDLLRHQVLDGDVAQIFEMALDALLEKVEKARLAATHRPRRTKETRSGSRHIPAEIRRQVWARDGGQCAYRAHGRRCCERGRLEFHHLKPFALGGASSPDNIELRCRAHNQYESDLVFGKCEAILVREREETYCGRWILEGPQHRLGPDRVDESQSPCGREHRRVSFAPTPRTSPRSPAAAPPLCSR